MIRSGRAAALLAAVALLAQPGTSLAASHPASVTLDPRHERGGAIPAHFVGLSIEWSLIERYMGPTARPAFVNLLPTWRPACCASAARRRTSMPFEPTAANTDEVITPEDLGDIRSTLDAANARDVRACPARRPGASSWGPRCPRPARPRPFVSPEHATLSSPRASYRRSPARERERGRRRAGQRAGPVLRVRPGPLPRRPRHLLRPGRHRAVPIIAPNTSEDILPWESVDGRTVPTRYFWDWPQHPRHRRGPSEGAGRRVRRLRQRPLLSARPHLREQAVPLPEHRGAAVRPAHAEPGLPGLRPRAGGGAATVSATGWRRPTPRPAGAPTASATWPRAPPTGWT